ncbi:MAG: nickel pincer cofactor biosynthesis protein LarB [Planctomycetes bacterium]|nr:nickel pincer cofactor biosynthesis protein LarB [Planctomycetota bacterium]
MDDRTPPPLPDVATVDHDRARRCGFPEVVLCDGKHPADAAAIAVEILTRAPRVLLTRASAEHAAALRALRPDAVWHERARCLVVDPAPLPREGLVAVVAAGTADLPVADEALVTAATMGAATLAVRDVGVAGLHRLLARLPELRRARVAVAVAGMEGALPSVLAGLLDVPVIALPTSVGYGVGLGGLAALATMLASCAAGVTAVNIDNGFGAGYVAALINRRDDRPAGDGPAAHAR